MDREATNDVLDERQNIERSVLRMWSECLDVPVKLTDDFFDLGGDSLSAIMLIGMCNERFGTTFTAGMLFASPTVSAQVAAIIEARSNLPCA